MGAGAADQQTSAGGEKAQQGAGVGAGAGPWAMPAHRQLGGSWALWAAGRVRMPGCHDNRSGCEGAPHTHLWLPQAPALVRPRRRSDGNLSLQPSAAFLHPWLLNETLSQGLVPAPLARGLGGQFSCVWKVLLNPLWTSRVGVPCPSCPGRSL